ncbi:MAG: hypothetical protein HYV63_12440 [Candidatus Schekmanbacteria bacterium]|nr:hypothetical protein [Candidatus Schekmanbacteria bacterium]
MKASSRNRGTMAMIAAVAACALQACSQPEPTAKRQPLRWSDRISVAPVPAQTQGDAPEERENWFYAQRAYPDGIPINARQKAIEQAEATFGPAWRKAAAAAAGTWASLGPAPTTGYYDPPGNWGNVTGRSGAIVVHPSNPNIIIYGSATGGIWRTDNGGSSWTPVSDSAASLSIGDIAMARSDSNILYAATGEADVATGAFHITQDYFGSGILKSTNGGQSWFKVSNASFPDYGFCSRIIVHPTDPNRVYAAMFFAFQPQSGAASRGGVYRSTDGGVSWSNVYSGLITDLDLPVSSPDTLYAAISFQRTAADPVVVASGDGGSSWQTILEVGSIGFVASSIKLAAAPSMSEVIYVSAYADGRYIMAHSPNGGGLWYTATNPCGVHAQGSYDHYIAVSPVDPNVVYYAERDVHRSVDGGARWVNLTNAFSCSDPNGYTFGLIHPDQHAIAFHPSDPNVVFLGNDGGLYRKNADDSFTNLNANLATLQFHTITQHPTDRNLLWGGTQDNGVQTYAGSSVWTQIVYGDGGRTAYDPTNPSRIYAGYTSFLIYTAGDAGRSPIPLSGDSLAAFDRLFPQGELVGFYPPIVSSPDGGIYLGTQRLWRYRGGTGNSASWQATASVALVGSANGVLNDVAFAPSNARIVYTASTDGVAAHSDDGGATWSNISAGLPNRVLTDIDVHPSNPSAAFLSASGFGTGHIFKTVNGGASWSDVSGGLPNIPFNAVAFDPKDSNRIFAGSDIGVFLSTDGGSSWATENNGLPNVPVTSFAFNGSLGTYRAATFGRGVWEWSSGGGGGDDDGDSGGGCFAGGVTEGRGERPGIGLDGLVLALLAAGAGLLARRTRRAC